MKQVLLVACSILTISTFSCSQIKVPLAVATAFNSKYPGGTDVKWGKESAKEYEAEFRLNGNNVSANFGSDGAWVETETVMKVADLPAAVVAAINKNYPGAVITTAEKLEEPGDKLLYETVIKVKGKKKTLELNADGSLAK
ncbi:MAG: PepSY-like domain-containing protein [Chitinophagales bacterium]